MPEAIWIDRGEELPPLAHTLESQCLDRRRHRIPARADFLSQAVSAAAGRGRRGLVRGHAARRQPRAAGPRAHRPRLAQGHSLRAPGSRGVLSQRQARDFTGVRHADRRRMHRPQASDRLRGTGQDAAWTSRCRKVRRAPTGRSVRSPANSWNTPPTMCCISSEIADRLDRAAARAWARAMGVGGLSGARGSAPLRARPRARVDDGCAASSSCRRRCAPARRALPYGAKRSRASAICRAAGSFPMRRSSSSQKAPCPRCRSP